MPVSSILPEPPALGLPPQFAEWRRGQEDAALRAVESDKRFVVLALPTGSGKSLAYMAAALLSGQRTVFLTSTRGLQNQLKRDFEPSGLFDIRGQQNYPCLYNPRETMSCDEGPCHSGVRCNLKDGGCTYFDAVRFAKNNATLLSTNYSYWMHQMEHGNGLGPFGMMVLDEAHDAIDQLGAYLSVELTLHDLETLDESNFPEYTEFAPWKATTKVWLDRARSRRETLEESIREDTDGGAAGNRQAVRDVRTLKNLERKLARLSSAEGGWVCQISRRGAWGGLTARFDPVWPADYAERRLFYGIKKVVLTSATIRPKTLELLGVGSENVEFAEYPSSFPVSRRPVYFVPSVRMDNRAAPEDLRGWIAKMDAILRPRLGHKGIIHAVSYKRAHWIARNSQHSEHMVVHDSRSAQETIAKFKRMKPPAILVSPSVSTGFDFPDDECRWQILCKVPFPDSRDLVTKARSERDKEYPMYQAMQEIVQMAGRSTRSERDWSEVFVVDDHFTWFWSRYRKFAPKWFAEAVKFCQVIPKVAQSN